MPAGRRPNISPENKQKILDGWKAGKKATEIAKEAGVSNFTVYNYRPGRKKVGNAKANGKHLAKAHALAAMVTPREKAGTRSTSGATERERLRGIVERLASKYPAILVELL